MLKSNSIECCLCNQLANMKCNSHVGYQNSQKYDIIHCDHCSTAFALPLKVDENIYNSIYAQVDKVPGYDRYLHYSQSIMFKKNPIEYLSNVEDVYWGVYQYLKKEPKTLRILEIGCGFGSLTYALEKDGYNIQGLDISQIAIEQAQKKFGPHFTCANVCEYAKKYPHSFDLIIFTEVIEHIQDIWGFLAACDQLLTTNGVMILTTPNKSFYPSDVLWETEPPPVHLWWFSENSISFLAEELGYNCNFVDFTEFNRKELTTPKYVDLYYIISSMKPNPNACNFNPTRQSRLDEQGNVYENKKNKGGFTTIKKILNIVGVSPFLKYLIARVKVRRELKKISSRRSILCAVLKKSVNF